MVFVFEVVALVFFAGSAFLVADFLAVDSFVTVVLVDFFGVVLVFAVAFLAVVALVVFLVMLVWRVLGRVVDSVKLCHASMTTSLYKLLINNAIR